MVEDPDQFLRRSLYDRNYMYRHFLNPARSVSLNLSKNNFELVQAYTCFHILYVLRGKDFGMPGYRLFGDLPPRVRKSGMPFLMKLKHL